LNIDIGKSMAPEVNNFIISQQIAYNKSKWSKYIHEK